MGHSLIEVLEWSLIVKYRGLYTSEDTVNVWSSPTSVTIAAPLANTRIDHSITYRIKFEIVNPDDRLDNPLMNSLNIRSTEP